MLRHKKSSSFQKMQENFLETMVPIPITILQGKTRNLMDFKTKEGKKACSGKERGIKLMTFQLFQLCRK